MQQIADLLFREDCLAKRLDVGHEADAVGDIRRHGGFEPAVADEGHHRMDILRRHLQGALQRLDVLEILTERILEAERTLVDLLRPLRLMLVAENPTLHVLGFQHEDAVEGHEHMIELGTAIARGQGDVVRAEVDRPVQHEVGKGSHQQLTDVALCLGRLEQPDDDEQRDKPPEHTDHCVDYRRKVH
ncbi:hypothetical protein D3C78_1213150 [compost metagenome]